MNIASRQTMWKKSATYPWDYRIEYLHCVDYRCYLVFPQLIATAGTDEVLSIVASTDASPSGDKKFLGTSMFFGLATYGGNWRHSGFYSWDAGGGSVASTYQGFRWTVSRNDGPSVTNISTGSVVWTGQKVETASSNAYQCWSPPQKGQYAYAWSADRSLQLDSDDWYWWLGIGSVIGLQTAITINSSGTAEKWPLSKTLTMPQMALGISSGEYVTYKFYDYWRKINGICVAHLIPCVMGGVIGVYDEIGGGFYSSATAYDFEPGPIIDNDAGYDVI